MTEDFKITAHYSFHLGGAYEKRESYQVAFKLSAGLTI